jgi:hypothetical protein
VRHLLSVQTSWQHELTAPSMYDREFSPDRTYVETGSFYRVFLYVLWAQLVLPLALTRHIEWTYAALAPSNLSASGYGGPRACRLLSVCDAQCNLKTDFN